MLLYVVPVRIAYPIFSQMNQTDYLRIAVSASGIYFSSPHANFHFRLTASHQYRIYQDIKDVEAFRYDISGLQRIDNVVYFVEAERFQFIPELSIHSFPLSFVFTPEENKVQFDTIRQPVFFLNAFKKV